MCCGLFGVQIVWGLQNVSTSRIFQTLGARIEDLPILWIAAPITGLLVQPLIGYCSDRTWGPLGRRRPYILAGAILTAIAMFAIPNVGSVWSACLALWLLTASINVAMEPFRALVADALPEEQRTEGFAVQVFFIGAGAVLASALAWMLSRWFGVDGVGAPGMLPASVRWSFYIGGVVLVAAVGWSVATTHERPPECLDEEAPSVAAPAVPSASGATTLRRSGFLWGAAGVAIAGIAYATDQSRELYVLAAIAAAFGLSQIAAVEMRRRGRSSIGMIEIVEDILHMPRLLRRLAVVQFFTWFGLFAMWIYTVPAVVERTYGGRAPGSPDYNAGADWVGILFAGYNGVAAIVALILPWVAARIGQRWTHAIALGLGALGLLGFVAIEDRTWLVVSAIGVGCAWASILSLPYAMLSTAVPPRKMGVYMGIHNIFLVLPQLVAATVLGPILRLGFAGEAAGMLVLAAASMALAALCSLTIPGEGESYAKFA